MKGPRRGPPAPLAALYGPPRDQGKGGPTSADYGHQAAMAETYAGWSRTVSATAGSGMRRCCAPQSAQAGAGEVKGTPVPVRAPLAALFNGAAPPHVTALSPGARRLLELCHLAASDSACGDWDMVTETSEHGKRERRARRGSGGGGRSSLAEASPARERGRKGR